MVNSDFGAIEATAKVIWGFKRWLMDVMIKHGKNIFELKMIEFGGNLFFKQSRACDRHRVAAARLMNEQHRHGKLSLDFYAQDFIFFSAIKCAF